MARIREQLGVPLTPNDFADLDAVVVRLGFSEKLSNQIPKPFAWKFNRQQLDHLLRRIDARRNLVAETGAATAAQP